jgi:hypothetical protein
MKKKSSISIPNPTLPFTEITIEGKTYKMVFQHAALALAEDKLRAKGHDVNLLGVYMQRTFSNVRVLFACSLIAYQPDIDFEKVQDLVDHENIIEILAAVSGAWTKSMAPPDSENPPKPAG